MLHAAAQLGPPTALTSSQNLGKGENGRVR